MDQPGTSTSDDLEICKLCNSQRRQYTCPKCEIPYCSLECYKSEAHLECSENFYKEWVETELKDRQRSPEDTKKIMDILKRMPTLDIDFDDENAEDIEEIDADESFGGPMDSDDEEDIPDLAKRLENVDLNNADEVWLALTDAERQEFEASLRNGEAEKLLPLWSPWWSNSSVGTTLIQELGDNEEKPNYVAECPAILDVPNFNEIMKSSPFVRFNLLNVLHAYAYMTLHCNGEHHNAPTESVAIFLELCENMGSNKVFQELASAIESVAQKAKNCQSLPGDEEAMAAAKQAVNCIITGPEESNPSFYVSAALSDLHRLFSSARKESSEQREKSIELIFSKRFRISQSDTDVSRKTLLLCTKKIEYYLSWVKTYGMRVN